jgi:hypothetical protein
MDAANKQKGTPLIRLSVTQWKSLNDALEHIELSRDCGRSIATRLLRDALANFRLPIRWAEQDDEGDGPAPLSNAFWKEASIRADHGGEVLHQPCLLVLEPAGSIKTVVAPPRWRGVLVDREALNRLFPLPEYGTKDDVPEPPQNKPQRRNPTERTIRDKVRELYAARPNDPPNIADAEQLVRDELRGGNRKLIRRVLADPEFADQRRAKGERRKRRLAG